MHFSNVCASRWQPPLYWIARGKASFNASERELPKPECHMHSCDLESREMVKCGKSDPLTMGMVFVALCLKSRSGSRMVAFGADKDL